jgi:lysyl-tRNA synthetase class 2
VTHYPATQSALAQLSLEFPGTAERFELFVDGVELANGYGELLDTEELLKRVAWQNERRQLRGATRIPVPEKFVAAMREGLPPCSGCALGFDRLFMVSQRAIELAEILAAREGTR